MALHTLAEASNHFNDPIQKGVADVLITVSPFYEYVPYIPVAGRVLTVNEELVAGEAEFSSENDLVGASGSGVALADGMTVTSKTFTVEACIGQAHVDRLNQATSAAAGVDQMAMQVASKGRNVGRKFWSALATGSNASPTPIGLPDGCTSTSGFGIDTKNPAGDDTDTADVMAQMDRLLNAITSQNGKVDWIMMNSGTMNAYRAAVRGSNQNYEYMTSPVSGQNLLSFNGVPIFRNDHIATSDASAGISETQNYAFAGCWEDGSNTGLGFIYPEGTSAGIDVRGLGESELYNAEVARVVQYGAWALFNSKGAARVYLDITS